MVPTGINLNESAGDNSKFKEEKKNNEPIGWGVLIADKVKVVTKIQWNSRNNGAVDSRWTCVNLLTFCSRAYRKNFFLNRFIRHSLFPDEIVSLHNVYEELDPNQRKMRASYVSQFLRLDLNRKFDVIGPYFECEAGMKHQFVMTCILNAIHALHLYGFEVMAIVLDCASTKLAAINYFTMGMAFYTKRDSTANDILGNKILDKLEYHFFFMEMSWSLGLMYVVISIAKIIILNPPQKY